MLLYATCLEADEASPMVRPVCTMLFTQRMTMAAARASRPEVGSSMKILHTIIP